MEPRSHRIEMLDALRGVAISCVLTEHFGGLLAVPFNFGYFGVDLFFILSGFLITGILLQMPDRNFWNNLYFFIARRSLRIFPMYYLTLLCLIVLDIDQSRSHWLPLTTYSWNYFCLDGGPFYLWSLSLEEQFYLFWPIIVLSLRSRLTILIILTAFLTIASYCQIIFCIVPALTPFNYTGLPNRMGSLCAGALAAILCLPNIIPRSILSSKSLEVFALLCILWSMASLRNWLTIWNGYGYPVAILLEAACSIFFICKCISGGFAIKSLDRLMRCKSLQYLGMISYGVYLIHAPLGVWFRNEIFGPIWHSIPFESLGFLSKLRWQSWIISFPLSVLLSISVASATWLIIERPVARYKDKYFSNRKLRPQEST
jgi:peptidoglycan/LPS O-acetylase OafA/YrhL